MNGGLALANGVLWIAPTTRRAQLVPYDLDGRRLGEGFHVPAVESRRACVAGVAVDRDQRVWIADPCTSRVRCFSAFGRELARFGDGAERDVAGALGAPSDLAVDGVEDETRILIASRGERRHALQLFDRDGALISSLRPRGEPRGEFQDLVRVWLRGRFALGSERASRAVQVYRDHEFHFMFFAPRPLGRGPHAEVRAAARVDDGRILVATGGDEASALYLCDAGGGLERVLASAGREDGRVWEPTDLVVEEGTLERRTRCAVLDRDGERVQVFNLSGVCYGGFRPDAPAETNA